MLVQLAPSDLQVDPVDWQLPSRHTPEQQSPSKVQAGELTQTLPEQVRSALAQSDGTAHDMPAIGRQLASQAKPVGEVAFGTHTFEQH